MGAKEDEIAPNTNHLRASSFEPVMDKSGKLHHCTCGSIACKRCLDKGHLIKCDCGHIHSPSNDCRHCSDKAAARKQALEQKREKEAKGKDEKKTKKKG